MPGTAGSKAVRRSDQIELIWTNERRATERIIGIKRSATKQKINVVKIRYNGFGIFGIADPYAYTEFITYI